LFGDPWAFDGDAQVLAAATLKIPDFDGVLAARKAPLAADLDRTVKPVVVDELLAVDEEFAPVV
jgi:hypothetical protein